MALYKAFEPKSTIGTKFEPSLMALRKTKDILKKAWIVLDSGKLVDVLSSRNSFDDAQEYAKNLYQFLHLPLSEKIPLAHYTKGGKRKRELFETPVPVFTSYKTDLYRDLMRCISGKGISNPEYKKLSEKWANAPKYVLVGHNPSVEVRGVFNVQIQDENEKQILVYEDPMSDGSRKVVRHEV